MKVDLGGDRLGSGNKMEVAMRNYERSTHDQSHVLRTTVSPGTLVPALTLVGMPGTTFDIDINPDIQTFPTLGPLFGSYKFQVDVFTIPMRNYNGSLHMNKPELGLNMKIVKLPQYWLYGNNIDLSKGNIDNQQVNPSSIFSYLGVRGIGSGNFGQKTVGRSFQAVTWLGYWDIILQYYANKQEKIGMVIHHDSTPITAIITKLEGSYGEGGEFEIPNATHTPPYSVIGSQPNFKIIVTFQTNTYQEFDPSRIILIDNEGAEHNLGDMFTDFVWDAENEKMTAQLPNSKGFAFSVNYYKFDIKARQGEITEPQLVPFELQNIADMKAIILKATEDGEVVTMDDTSNTPYPYRYALQNVEDTEAGNYSYSAALGNQEGLAVKTYQSDIFNNWLDTEWIDGNNGVNEISKVAVQDGAFKIDDLNLAYKVYKMLNRITVSGGSYDDWIGAVYTHEGVFRAETPIYMGGLSKEIVFQEVVSQSQNASGTQPLGTLAGKGRFTEKHKGGKVRIRIGEPSFVMAIMSITPRIDYSQGNEWYNSLKTMDDFHKPPLDGIGFQDLITDKMAAWDTNIDSTNDITYYSAGKQPAWIDYMTEFNKVKGNFADPNQQQFMTLTRRYEAENVPMGKFVQIKDLTTYIDPAKYNYIFADASRDAQNFMVNLGFKITSRRKMSAKLMPNL